MRRTVLLTALLLAACAPAAAEWLPLTGGHRHQPRCTATHHCAQRLTANRRLKRWTTPQRFPADASLEIRARINGKVHEGITSGLRVVYLNGGVIATVTATAGAGPLVVRYAAERPRHITLIYWTD